jgi:PKD repeat protein
MENSHPTHGRRYRWTFWIVGLASLAWLLLRSLPNPRRLSYPCQRAALASSMAFVGYLLSLVGCAQLYRLLKRRTRLGAVGLLGLTLLLVLGQTSSGIRPATAARTVALDLPAWTSPSAISNVYVVPDVPAPDCSLDGGTLPSAAPCNDPAYALADAGVDALIDTMESRGEYLHATASHPGGIVGADDVVVVKINNQWGLNGQGAGVGRLITSTDVLKGVLWRIVQHPDGFSGEVVVAENTQWVNPDWNHTPANAEDRNQTYQDVVDVFQGLGYPVSLYVWDYLGENLLRGGSVGGGHPPGEYINGNYEDGYVLLEDPAGGGSDELSYPKFETPGGSWVSMRYGVWDGSSYDSDSLTLINLPVLKAHGMAGATIAWKNLIGFVTIEDDYARYGDWDQMHDFFWGYTEGSNQNYGLIGRQLALIRAPDLNVVDAIWVADDNYDGNAARQDVLLASADPFAVDWYASEYVLLPAMPWEWQDVSAARVGTFRSATRTNQNSAEAVWPGGSYPYIDLYDSYDGDTPSDDEKNQMNVYLAGAGACALTCGATVPGSALVDQAVSFQGTATATGCSGQPGYSWDFGDGSSASGQNATHSYASAGSYDWSLTVTVDSEECTEDGTITVTATAMDFELLVPAVVRAPGEEGTQWRTALTCLNLANSTTGIDLTLVGDGISEMRDATLAGGATVEWVDVVVDLFELPPSESTFGAVHLAADGPILVTSRTYNQAPEGTYGQYLPALDESQTIGLGDTGYLLQLKSNDFFRTNVGFANLGASTCDVRVQLYDEDGDPVGTAYEVTVEPGQWKPVNDIFAKASAGSHDLAYATVEVLSSGGQVWAYASVVDDITGDATTIPVLEE